MDSSLLRLPPLDPLRGFVAAARHLSFTHAAEELCLSQSAISRQVQTLEAALGTPLFVRGVRSLALTEAGARLAGAAEQWLVEYGRLAARLRTPERPTVTISAGVGVSALWLVPQLPDFQDAHPDIEVRISTSNRVVDLLHEDIDLALRYCADRDAPDNAWRLFSDTLVPVAHPAIGKGLVLDRTTLPQHVLLDFDDARFPWLSWSPWLTAHGLDDVRPRGRIRFNHYDQLIHAAASGQGLAIGRKEMMGPLFREGRLMPLGSDRHPMTGRGFWLVPAPGVLHPAAEVFAAWIRAVAARCPSPEAT
ncbi:LysR substrate-binding domain-containing protein [Denitromonas ohlonensis]|jgi:DNA-binding transcriptional LysR family regulator|uniref:LysR family transcriptional regulator n=2 Tax=Denitromonas TaxID=139331 RepID=A0A558EG62_9RHOO|nr:LysR substrate-binding domain-containing protein [Denitromonas ohlonensis]TVO68477.1 LysR family transcriptional regulator [Denitromonas ohlonensis]TVO74755.1 LysR family transcriptional regulator [Denitromonas ohlonensis]TVT72227.1 MAG: LysR family transcriptional regulator [Denitromonas halophila]